jgi:uncharacterized spore protein YtfJ
MTQTTTNDTRTNQAAAHDAGALDTIRELVDSATAGKVFGAPITQDGLTVLPVAKVSGGGGGGNGGREDADDPRAGGVGGGLGLSAKPLGVFVIKEGTVGWRPAIDINKVILGGQLVAITALLVVRALIKARGRGRTEPPE